MNTFVNLPAFPAADLKVVVRPNFDTLYSSAWLDLTKEPMIVSAPDTQGRYYLLPMLDMWTDVFASPGWRTTEHKPATMPWSRRAGTVATGRCRSHRCADAVCLDHWSHQDRWASRLRSGEQDPGGLKITPLSQWGKTAAPVVGTVDPGIDMKTPPKVPGRYYARRQVLRLRRRILKLQPPHITDEPILAQMKRIGIERGKSFDLGQGSIRWSRPALENAPKDALKLMAWKVPAWPASQTAGR